MRTVASLIIVIACLSGCVTTGSGYNKNGDPIDRESSSQNGDWRCNNALYRSGLNARASGADYNNPDWWNARAELETLEKICGE